MARTCASGASGIKDVTDLMGGALLAWVFIMPLVFYVLAMMLWGIQRVLMGRARMDQVRIVLFWSFLHPSHLCSCTDWCVGLSGQVRHKIS